MAFDRQYMCRLKDSTVYALRIAKEGDKTYVSCVAEFTDKTPVEKASIEQGGKVESEEELKKKEAKLLARDNAEKFTTTHNGWIYEIPEWKAKNLTKPLSDLLEDAEKPKENTTAEPNSVTPDIIETPKVEDANKVVPDAVTAPEVGDPNTAESK